MALEPGQRILNYVVGGTLGKGGMGEVYRARDSRLDREVALKVLPAGWDDDRERALRFEREARTLASLNHPNVGQVYGFEVVDGTRVLVLELVEGEDLSERVGRGPLAPDEAADICRQVAEGLEAAHEAGVIHRDLKSANVRITPGGVAKVLDFGLAKAHATGDPPQDAAPRDAGSSLRTEEGLLLGTPTYMSPEQVRGRPVDRRTDVWAFGCLLYECLAGSPPFEGASVADTLAAVVQREPDLSRLPPKTSRSVRNLIVRCLDKDPRTRLRDIGEARVVLARATDEDAAAPPRTARRAGVTLAAVGVVAVAAAAAATLVPRAADPAAQADVPVTPELPAERRLVLADARFTWLTDINGTVFDAAISRDGKFVAFVSDRDGPLDAWMTQLGTDRLRNVTQGRWSEWWEGGVRNVGFDVAGTRLWLCGGTFGRMHAVELMTGELNPYFDTGVVNVDWSTDARSVVYQAAKHGDPICVAPASHGTLPIELVKMEHGVHQHFPTWSKDGSWIYFARGRLTAREFDLFRIRPDKSEEQQLTHGLRDAAYPTPIDDRTLLYVASDADGTGPWLWELDVERKVSRRATIGIERYTSIAAAQDGRTLVATVAKPRETLWSVPILADSVATERDAATVPEFASAQCRAPRFRGDALYCLSSRSSGHGLWRLRDGKAEELLRGSDVSLDLPPAVAPGGDSVALALPHDGRMRLHVVDANGGIPRLVSDALEVDGSACWSPDGRWIAVGGEDRAGRGLFRIDVRDGSHRRLVLGDALNPVWSPTKDLIVYAAHQVGGLHQLLGVRPSSAESAKIPDVSVRSLSAGFTFLPTGNRLVFMQGQGPSQDFWMVDLDTGERRQLTRLDSRGSMRTFDVDPSGARIVFDRLDLNADVVLIQRPADEK